ncbi:MAG: hypothetical protein QY327_02280 [Fimbriimonadaceae bacterium]|nr:MAG: hypothetical protein QY327_02280 [Fimbriimonadaceae bacterium]
MYLALFLCAMQFDKMPSWTPDELKVSSRFEFTGSFRPVGNDFGNGTFKRTSDGASVDILVTKSSPNAATRPIVMSLIPKVKIEVPASGYKLGKQCLVTNRPGGYTIVAVNNYEQITARITAPLNAEGYGQRPDDFSADAGWLEKMARISLVNYAQKRMGEIERKSITGHSVSTFVASGSDARYFDVEAWADASGVGLTRNDAACRASFVWRGKQYVLPWASQFVKIGGDWKELDDVVMVRDGRIFAPVGLLEVN